MESGTTTPSPTASGNGKWHHNTPMAPLPVECTVNAGSAVSVEKRSSVPGRQPTRAVRRDKEDAEPDRGGDVHPPAFREGKSRGDEDESLPATAATSVVTDDELLSFSGSEPVTPEDCEADPQWLGRPLKHKTRSILSLPLSLLSPRAAPGSAAEDEALQFDEALADEMSRMSLAEEEIKQWGVDFSSFPTLRNVMEPFLAVARECLVSYAALIGGPRRVREGPSLPRASALETCRVGFGGSWAYHEREMNVEVTNDGVTSTSRALTCRTAKRRSEAPDVGRSRKGPDTPGTPALCK